MYWKLHWDTDNQRWHGQGQRIGKKGWGSDTTPGCHTTRNKAEKERKARALQRRAAEDEQDPEGAETRQKKRLEQGTQNELKHKARQPWLAAMHKLEEVEGRGASLSSNMEPKEDAGALQQWQKESTGARHQPSRADQQQDKADAGASCSSGTGASSSWQSPQWGKPKSERWYSGEWWRGDWYTRHYD